ncbi:small GTP-binding protein [Tritrichomonas foetus]|uniref:Small GTP-binding protein n=1 Tax=Tritrichomonas foetus TaxID=1144522 RepID=A0A1J4JH44_9EUKA|nr:small GTP-binding protein [Tritrichomonas foetus]|eukprot:OHS98462.1 small GTP-binding protein [Tritrichomonas foetus]
MSSNTNGRRPLKVILVGSSGVGKTSLISAFFDQPYETETQPTVAPAYCGATIELKDKSKVDLQIWDTAGQERFQSIGGMFYRESDIAFVCFDFQNKATIPNWINRVHAQVSDCIIFLVATKSDILSDEETAELQAEAPNLVRELKAQQFFLTSASKMSGVRELFQEAGECVNQICKTTTAVSVPLDNKRPKEQSCKC